MSSTFQAILASWSLDPKLALGVVASSVLYLRGWSVLHRTSPQRFPTWRLGAFTAGLAASWLAIASPLDAFSGLLLSAHMVQHLLLMSVAPPLLLLGAPLLPLLRGLPRKFARDGLGPFLVWPALRRCGQMLTHPVCCWIVMAIILCAWHVPPAFDLALRSPGWHKLEHACFLGTSILFWWPVVRPFPSRPQWPVWSVPLYLLAADLLNTTLSAILTFSDHVLYRPYLQAPRLFGTTALSDQICAGVLMWVPGSLVFLVPAALTAIEYLTPRSLLVRPQPVLLQKETRRTQRTPILGSRLAVGRLVSLLPSLASVQRRLYSRFGVDDSHRFNLLSVPLVGSFLRAQSGRRLLQTLMFLLAAAVVLDGILGPQVSATNLAGVLPWTYWRAFVVIILLAMGNFFCMACPFMLFRELGRRLGLPQRPWPRALRSKWFGVALLALFFWGYEVFSLWDKPIWTAWLIINYFIVALVIDALFRGASFCKYVCPIGQFQFVTSLVSPLEVKVREPKICADCKTHDCLRGNNSQRGCELDLYLPRKSGNLDCTFCLDCVRACPHDNIGLITTAPGMTAVGDPPRSSLGRLSRRLDLAAMALIFVFAAFVNAAFMTAPVASWRDTLAGRWGILSHQGMTGVLLIVALVLAPAAIALSAACCSRILIGASVPARELLCRFSMCLVPLGAAMWAAHFLFHLNAGWASGWTALQRATQDAGVHWFKGAVTEGFRPIFSVNALLAIQIVALDGGLLLALYLGWRVARWYAPRARDAVKLLVPWASLAMALYGFGVWIFLQPMQMRGMVSPMS